MRATTALACAFPPREGFNGALTTIADLARHGIPRSGQIFAPTKRAAFFLIMQANNERGQAVGNGNRADRRTTGKRHTAAEVRWRDERWANKQAADAELHSEGRVHRNTRAQRHE